MIQRQREREAVPQRFRFSSGGDQWRPFGPLAAAGIRGRPPQVAAALPGRFLSQHQPLRPGVRQTTNEQLRAPGTT